MVVQSENSGVEGKKIKNKNEEGEILVASLERNSHQARVQVFLFQSDLQKKTTKNKSFSQHFGPAGLSFAARPNSCERDALLYLPQSMPSICFDISLSTGGNAE